MQAPIEGEQGYLKLRVSHKGLIKKAKVVDMMPSQGQITPSEVKYDKNEPRKIDDLRSNLSIREIGCWRKMRNKVGKGLRCKEKYWKDEDIPKEYFKGFWVVIKHDEQGIIQKAEDLDGNALAYHSNEGGDKIPDGTTQISNCCWRKVNGRYRCSQAYCR